MSKNFVVGFFMALLFIYIGCGPARRSIALEDGWDLLGERKVNFVRDVDVMEVHSTSKFSAIKFKVEGKEIRLNQLTVHFQNGDKLSPSVDELIPPDKTSREIEISPEGRFITKIEFRYRTTGNLFRGRANVLVFGKRYTGS